MAQTLDKFDTLLEADLTADQRADLHDAWLAARAEALVAYHGWCDAARLDKGDAYAVYRAAEQREAQAADTLRQIVAAPAAAGADQAAVCA